MSVTVVVCTYNRCQLLEKALESIAAQRVPESLEWDVLVVDNNSKDETPEVVRRFQLREPARFKYLRESKQGLSYARNAGIRRAQGEIVAFTDDDAVVAPDWLWNLTYAVHDGEWAGVGGRIIPTWTGALPEWLSAEDAVKLGPFGGFDAGTEAGPLLRPFYGGNMAFPKKTFEKYGGFRVDLGHTGTNLLGREDVELANRLLAYGERLRYEPNAVIRHPVLKNRMAKSYVLRWFYWDGRSEVMDLGPPEMRWSIAGVPLNLVRRFLRWTLQSIISIGARKRFACERNAWLLAGSIHGCYNYSRLRKGQGISPASRQPSSPEAVAGQRAQEP